MTVEISRTMLEGLGATLSEDSWWDRKPNTLSTGDTVAYKGTSYTFTDADFYSNDTLDQRLESITQGSVELITSSSGTLKYLLLRDSWWNSYKLVDTTGRDLVSGTKTTPSPTPPKSPDDNY